MPARLITALLIAVINSEWEKAQNSKKITIDQNAPVAVATAIAVTVANNIPESPGATMHRKSLLLECAYAH